MIVASSSTDYKPLPEGTYVATCIRIIDLGTQITTYKGVDKTQRKVLITWEVPEVRAEDKDGNDMPALISTRYTASLHEKAALRKDLEAWRGRRFTEAELKGFDLKNVLGQSCQIQVLHTERDGATYANISAIMSLPKGLEKPVPEHGTVNFSLDKSEFSAGVYDDLTDKTKAIIAASPEFKLATGQMVMPDQDEPDYSEEFSRAPDDDIPF